MARPERGSTEDLPDMPADFDVDLGNVRLTDLPNIDTRVHGTSPLAWVLAAVLLVILLVVVFAFLVPTSGRLAGLQEDLTEARQTVERMQEQIRQLESQNLELTQARASLAAETEKKASELETIRREEETDAAEEAKRKKGTTKAKKRRKGKAR